MGNPNGIFSAKSCRVLEIRINEIICFISLLAHLGLVLDCWSDSNYNIIKSKKENNHNHNHNKNKNKKLINVISSSI